MKNGALAESYEYDSLGQLIRANNVAANYTILYRYDKAGNIVSSERFDYADASSFFNNIEEKIERYNTQDSYELDQVHVNTYNEDI